MRHPGTATQWTGPSAFHAAVLRDLEAGHGVWEAATCLAAADPAQLRTVVATWPGPGTVARVWALVNGPASVTECEAALEAEPAWALALFLALDETRGQQVAANAMGRALRAPATLDALAAAHRPW
jgi:hypothetical protein